ncbi:MAG: DUF87 domain-containing protein [Candidatus Lokiarchaeota archaeon]|nr:DUF87 domain-containing protein [Candidatus Lokiarchaeota archaeon]
MSEYDNISEEDEDLDIEAKWVGRLTGKTQIDSAQLLIETDDIERTNFLSIYGEKDKKGNRKHYLLLISEIWNDLQGMRANIKVIGDRPPRPFEIGAKVYLATKEQIIGLLGINNPPETSISFGNLLGYDFEVNLRVEDLGRIFITGKSGSGKSYTMGILCEEFLKKGIPIVILDRHGEYGSLKISGDENAGESEFIDKIIEFSDLNINKGADIDIEYLFSLTEKDIVAPNLCSIVNLRGIPLEAQETIAGKLLDKLYSASTSRKIPPFYLFLDEAHLFAGKKRTKTCDVVKLFSQEGRKFGANLVIGTQRPQLLDTTIRAQAGTWIVHNLTDIRDINITISSAEDLSNENKSDVNGLDKGECILSGEAASGVPLFVKVRKRSTKHGGMGFNALDFLPKQTIEELQKRKSRILGNTSEEELEAGKELFQDLLGPKSDREYLSIISQLKVRVKELEKEVNALKERYNNLESGKGIISSDVPVDERIKELKTDVQVWMEKYRALKERTESGELVIGDDQAINQTIERLEGYVKDLENQIEQIKQAKSEALKLAEKSIAELKKGKKNKK